MIMWIWSVLTWLVGIAMGVMLHNWIVREDLKLAEMTKRLVAAKMLAKAVVKAQEVAVKVEDEVKKI